VTICALVLIWIDRSDPDGAEEDKELGTVEYQVGPETGPAHLGTFTFGTSTTFVTGPLRPDGHIDYTAALNERLARGVTPEQNVNVAVWSALGPTPVGGGKVPPGYFEAMGVAAPPLSADSFLGLRTYSDRHALGQAKASAEALGKVYTKRPWAADESALFVGWLQTNAKALSALREAAVRAQYYNPLLPDAQEKGLSTAAVPNVQSYREVAGAFCARALLYTAQGNAVEAWQDLLAAHRLARHVGRGGTVFETLTSTSLEMLVCRAEVAFLDRIKPDAKTAQGYLHDLLALPQRRPVTEQIDQAERMWFLDTIMQLNRQGINRVPLYGADDQPIHHKLHDEDLKGIDWNAALEIANKGHDRLVGVFREPDRAARSRKLLEIDTEFRALTARFGNGNGAATLASAGSAGERWRLFGEMLFAGLNGNYRRVMDASDRAHQVFDNTLVAFALARYQRINGRYPDSLTRLAPDHLTAVPIDLFSGTELIYRPNKAGFLLYSVGVNGIDDEARGSGDDPPGDDIVVQIPGPVRG
jgi:hypothetical protein